MEQDEIDRMGRVIAEGARPPTPSGEASKAIIRSLIENRCYACGWPLGSCLPFNCAMRYRDDSSELAGWRKRVHEMQDVATEAHRDRAPQEGAISTAGPATNGEPAAALSEKKEPDEGYPGIAHDLETIRTERDRLLVALKRASYALFQIKRHADVGDFTRKFASDESDVACVVIDNEPSAPSAMNAPLLPGLKAALEIAERYLPDNDAVRFLRNDIKDAILKEEK